MTGCGPGLGEEPIQPVTDGAEVSATCRACGAGLVPGLNPRYCEPCLSRIPVPFGDMAWQARLAGRLHGLTGGETPAVFRCLVDAAAPVLPLMVGAREALVARWPGAKRTAHDAAGWWLHSYGATCGYLSALARGDSMRFDLDGRPVAPVSGRDRARAAALRESLWVSGTRADREAHEEALARSGRCSWVGGRCMVEADGGPMGRLRVEMPGFMCGRPARAVPVGSATGRG